MIEVIPAIDLIDGKCVRLTKGDFSRCKIYADDPIETARRFASLGLSRLHIVDLDGARRGMPQNIGVLEKIAAAVDMKIDFGGGIKTEANIKSVFDAGAEIANVGSIAVTEPEIFFAWLEHYGRSSILLGADSLAGKIAISGWQQETDLDTIDFLADYAGRGVDAAFVTDIERDGAMGGPSFRLYREITSAVPDLKLIASGGVSSVNDFDELEQISCVGVIVGKAFYEGAITAEDIRKYVG